MNLLYFYWLKAGGVCFFKVIEDLKIGRKETRELYINVMRIASSITSKVGGISFTLTA